MLSSNNTYSGMKPKIPERKNNISKILQGSPMAQNESERQLYVDIQGVS